MNVFLDAEQVCTISEPRNAHEIRQHMANRRVVLVDRMKELHGYHGQLLLVQKAVDESVYNGTTV